MGLGDYLSYQKWNRSKTTDSTLAAADTSKTLISARSAKDQIFVQKVVYMPVTAAAQAISIKDSNGTPLIIGTVPASQSTPITFDFGPKGVPLTLGKDLLATCTAGPAGQIHVEAYEKLGAVVNMNEGSALQ